MEQTVEMKKLEQKSFRFIEQDGLMEIMMGIVLVGLGLTFGSFAYTIVVLAAVFLMTPLLGILRKRYTYPRIGYAKLPSEDGKNMARGMFIYVIIIMVGVTVGVGILGGFRDVTLFRKWSPLLAALLLTGGFDYAYSKSGSMRYRIYMVLAIGIGILFSLLTFEGYDGVAASLVLLGVIFFVIGAVLFLTFMHKYPKAWEQTNRIMEKN